MRFSIVTLLVTLIAGSAFAIAPQGFNPITALKSNADYKIIAKQGKQVVLEFVKKEDLSDMLMSQCDGLARGSMIIAVKVIESDVATESYLFTGETQFSRCK